MAKTPFGNSKSNTKTIYNSRTLYDESYLKDVNQFDIWSDLPLYGKVDEQGIPMYPDESNLAYISQDGDSQQLAVLSFVANAFRKMREHYSTVFKLNTQLGETDFFGTDLVPTRAWESPVLGYSNYIQSFYDDFYNTTLAQIAETGEIKNFDDFVKILLQNVKETGKAFTRLAFGESRNTTIFNTGLAIEIYEGDYGDDSVSFDFINDPNFPIFDELCRKYGFKIDRNIPWRIVANVKSANLAPFISEQLQNNNKDFVEKDVFDQFYIRYNQPIFFSEFVDYLKIFYSTFYQANPTFKEAIFNSDQFCKTSKFRIVERENPLDIQVSEEQQLVLFYEFRLAELNLKASVKRQQFHLKNVRMIFRSIKNKNIAIQKSLEYIQYNIGTAAYREVPLAQNNLTRAEGGVTMSAQSQFDERTGDFTGYLTDDLSSS